MIFPRAADFPKCKLYLRDEMPKVVRVPRIANAMRELGRLDGALFDRALKPGTQPTLLLFDRPMPSDSILGERWLIPRDKSGRMVLNVSLFEDFEAQSSDRLMGTAHVSARPGSPGAREFSGRFDRRGIIETRPAARPVRAAERAASASIARRRCSASVPASSARWSIGGRGRRKVERTRRRRPVLLCTPTARSTCSERLAPASRCASRRIACGSDVARARTTWLPEEPHGYWLAAMPCRRAPFHAVFGRVTRRARLVSGAPHRTADFA